MFRNYFKIAFRNLAKNKIYSFINIAGLTIGLASFLLIALYIFDELTADGFHQHADDIYRVIENKTSPEGKESRVASVAYNISAQAKSTLPEVANATRFSMLGRSNILNTENNNFFYESYYIADEAFLQIFDFKLIEGDRNTALKEPHSVIVTEETAQKIFGKIDVLGKSVVVDRDSLPYKITGVLKNFPANSHLQFNLAFSESTLQDPQTIASFNSDWSSNNFVTYFLFKKDANIENATTKINQLVAQHRPADKQGKSSFYCQPLKDIHFYSSDIDGDFGSGNIFYIYVFSILGLFVLVIACINYINLTTARFANRAREIGVRKISGALKKNLVLQFLSEAFVITVISFILSFILVRLLLPSFNAFSEKQLTLGTATDVRIWIGVCVIIFAVTLLSGTYPAFYQAKLKPASLFKTNVDQGRNSLSIRKTLVVFQFTISIIMIVSTLVVYLQLKYVNDKNLGFNKEQLLVVDINSGLVRRSAAAIKAEYAKLTAVKDVSVTSRVPGEWKVLPKAKVVTGGGSTAGNDMYFIGADDQFLSTFQVSLLKGRNFNVGTADSASVLINETAALLLGIKEPADQLITIPSLDFSGNAAVLEVPFTARVIGITKDFNFQSLHEKIAPMVIAYESNPIHNIDYFTVRVSGNDIPATLKQLEAILLKIDPAHLFEYNFLDNKWSQFYREDQKRQTLFIAVALITIIIACLGLFGLATYAAEQRIKEIGIRKVLGASVGSIVGMLSKDFLKLVLIATCIALPLSWAAMYKWLQDFAYRINISWWVFAVAGVTALTIALVTISFQAIKAAIANPVKSLRAE